MEGKTNEPLPEQPDTQPEEEQPSEVQERQTQPARGDKVIDHGRAGARTGMAPTPPKP